MSAFPADVHGADWTHAPYRSSTSTASASLFRWLPRVSRGTAENSVVSPGSSLGSHGRTRGTYGNIERACVVRYFGHNTMEETIMKRMIYVNHAIL